jgi:hypothetical protein
MSIAPILIVVAGLTSAAANAPFTGLPLTGAEAEVFLATAEVVKLKDYESPGITNPRKATLSDGEFTYDAVFKDINELHKRIKVSSGQPLLNLRDSFKHEIAAYELAKLLDMDLVPPCVGRKIHKTNGALCMWVEGAMTEGFRKTKNIQPPDPAEYVNQMNDIKLFRQLIWDTDYKNISNILIDGNWKLYKIDSSRSFRNDPDLRDPEKLKRFSRSSVEALRQLDRDELDKAMAPWLNRKAIDAIWERRNRLLELIKDRIDTQSEEAVLFD